MKLHNSTRGFSYESFPTTSTATTRRTRRRPTSRAPWAAEGPWAVEGSLGSRRSGKSRAERIAEQKAELERQRAEAKAKAEQARIDRELMRQRVAEAGGNGARSGKENELREEESGASCMA